MDEDGCGSSGVWNIFSYISLDNVVFQFLNGVNLMCYDMLGRVVDLLVWIGLWNKFRIHRVPIDPIKWS